MTLGGGVGGGTSTLSDTNRRRRKQLYHSAEAVGIDKDRAFLAQLEGEGSLMRNDNIKAEVGRAVEQGRTRTSFWSSLQALDEKKKKPLVLPNLSGSGSGSMSSRKDSSRSVLIQAPKAHGFVGKKGSVTERRSRRDGGGGGGGGSGPPGGPGVGGRPKRDYVADYISGGITAQGSLTSSSSSRLVGGGAGNNSTTSGTGLSYDARDAGPLGPRMSQLTKTPKGPALRGAAGQDQGEAAAAAASTPRGHLNGIDLALEENRPHDALMLSKKLMVQLSNLDMADKERMLMELQGRVARTHLSLGDPGKAVEAYRKQLSIASKHGLAPECSGLYGELGRLQVSIGQLRPAVPDGERLL
jgi:hypothetical protein